jgi:hypothetical protein
VFKIVSIVYYSLCFVAAVLHGRSRHAKAVASIVDTMYNIVFPFAHVRLGGGIHARNHRFLQFVALSFWILYAIDREMVYPEYLDALLPAWHNQIMVK